MTDTRTDPDPAALFGASKAAAADPADTTAAAGMIERLTELRGIITDLEGREKEAYAERLALFHAARALDPPVIMTVIAGASGVSEVAVARAFQKERVRAAAEKAT